MPCPALRPSRTDAASVAVVRHGLELARRLSGASFEGVPGAKHFIQEDAPEADEIAFAPLEQRLARRLLIEANSNGIVAKTHQQLAADLGSVREVVSRILARWAEAGLVELRRGADPGS